MDHYHLYNALFIHKYTLDNWDAEPQHQNYFEIIFVLDGNGYCTINDTRHPYGEHNIFLLAKENTYDFEISTSSKFIHFKFTELLFSSKINLPERKQWLQRIEQLLQHSDKTSANAVTNKSDQKILWNIQKVIFEEFNNENTFYRNIISNAISTILSIMVRNLAMINKKKNKKKIDKSSKIESIVAYIKQNVYENERTKIHSISEKFKMSQSSISSYFKKETGESIHQYITKYKMQLVEYRLQHTKFTIAEIASQLGYTDESHLTKTFKKHFSLSPKQYRDQLVKTMPVKKDF
ncbi:AraC family transcriptional regulator [Aquimarina addita]|uniref:AraC family transcriptional regulator n=1 Tax=Aquimarina addita TaxID=870485 RepID=A0ABP7X8Y9_9FLAO